MSQTSAPDRERMETVWRQRALRLSKRPAAAPETPLPVLTAWLGNERYGIELTCVAEVLSPVLCTPIPGAASVLAGVINVHGEIRPVMNLKLLLNLGGAASGGRPAPAPVILLRWQEREIGLQVDRVEQVRAISSSEWRADGETNLASPYLKKITMDTLLLLDPEALFTKFAKEESAT